MNVTEYPFRHLVVDGWWPALDLRAVLGEFPSIAAPGWKRYSNSTERKLEGPPGLWGPRTRDMFRLIESRIPALEELFGIERLHMETVGGGYHLIEPGGYLNIHADFNRSPHTGRYRRLNLLIYLNDDWTDPGGHLELWGTDTTVDGDPVSFRAVDVVPEFGRTVVFETSSTSWHGHPTPASRERRSIAAYMFTEEPPPGYSEEHSTVWL